jgi:type IV pilus assembly protein PilW
MVALTIGLIILAALGQLFVSSRSGYVMEEGLGRIQEAGRFGMEFLEQDIRMAGYAGCHNPSQGAGVASGTTTTDTTCTTTLCNLATPTNEATTFNAEGIRGYTYIGSGGTTLGEWSPALPSSLFSAGDVAAGTDVVLVQYASATNTWITGNSPANNVYVRFSDTAPLAGSVNANDILIVSDCKNTDVFRVTAAPAAASGGVITIDHDAGSTSGNASAYLSHSYGNDAEILRLVSRVYFVRNNAITGPSLARKDLLAGATPQDLAEGIEDMRILYGVDTDGDGIANRYVRANSVGAGVGSSWNDVVSIRLGLLIRTPSNVDTAEDTNTYEVVDGITVDPVNDNRRRQVYRVTIQLRN